MKRLLAVIAALVLLATACQKNPRAAATVNDTRISDQAVVDELNAIAGNPDYLKSVEQASGQKVHGATPDSFDAAFVAQVLRLQIAYELVHQEVAKRNLAVSDTCRAAALQDTYRTLSQTQDVNDGKRVFDAFPKPYQDTISSRNLDFLVLQADLVKQQCVAGDQAAEDYYKAHPEAFAKTCFSVIVADASQVEGLYQQLQGGADFATLAASSSTDSATASKGGDFGCVTAQETPQVVASVLASTPVGQVAAPITSGQQGVIVKVTGTQPAAPLDEVRQQAEELAANEASQAVGDWLTQAIKSSTITVDARYGTWNPERGSVDPPQTASTAPATDESTSSSGG